MKLGALVETFGRAEMDNYATWCGRALALSHARSGSPAVLSGYMGKSDAFDKSIAAFSVAYADQNEKDHAAFARAVRKGTVEVLVEEEKVSASARQSLRRSSVVLQEASRRSPGRGKTCQWIEWPRSGSAENRRFRFLPASRSHQPFRFFERNDGVQLPVEGPDRHLEQFVDVLVDVVEMARETADRAIAGERPGIPGGERPSARTAQARAG